MMSGKSYSTETIGEDITRDFAHRAKDTYVLITGANTGLGFETARCLAKAGAKVAITCRSQQKVDETIEKLKSLGCSEIRGVVMELSSLDSVRSGAESYLKSGAALNILINNAGVMACPLEHSKEGFECQIGINHLSHFLLTKLLLPLLQSAAKRQETARVVNLSSMGHFLFSPSHGVSLNDLEARKEYDAWSRYGESKLANILHAKEITRRYGVVEGQPGVIGVAAHPGAILDTDLKRHMGSDVVAHMMWKLLWHPKAMWVVLTSPYKTIPQGVATPLLAALTDTPHPGGYYADCRLETWAVHDVCDDADLACRLWERSEEAVKAPAAAPAT